MVPGRKRQGKTSGYDFLDLAGLEAAHTDVHAPPGAFPLDQHLLDVGFPTAAGQVVGMAHVIARHGTLSADITYV